MHRGKSETGASRDCRLSSVDWRHTERKIYREPLVAPVPPSSKCVVVHAVLLRCYGDDGATEDPTTKNVTYGMYKKPQPHAAHTAANALPEGTSLLAPFVSFAKESRAVCIPQPLTYIRISTQIAQQRLPYVYCI